MKYFSCFFLCVITATAQQSSTIKILDYSVTASIDEQLERITGTASVWLGVTADSLNSFTFSVPKPIEVSAVRDLDDDQFPIHKISREGELYYHLIGLSSRRYRGDSVFVRIEFEERLDTSSASAMFINSREFIFPFAHSYAWLPDFNVTDAANASIEISLPFAYSIISSGDIESQVFDNQFKWNVQYDSGIPLSEAFTLCGSLAIDKWNKTSDDSLTGISFIVSREKFNRRFADSLLSQLVIAAQYFKHIAGMDSLQFSMEYIFIGDNVMQNEGIHAGASFIQRNSPAYLAFDSSAFVRTKNNLWLVELARSFSPFAEDSLTIISDGWAKYLASRYLFSSYQNPAYERQERLDLLVHALSFYPAPPIIQGKIQQPAERKILAARAEYFFLMLEYIVGRETFDNVILKMSELSVQQRVTLHDVETICEEAYGSSLEWFFKEWLMQASIPEFAIQWKTEKTNRGTALVTTEIEQRGDVFSMPLNLSFNVGSKIILKRILAEQQKQEFIFELPSSPAAVELDPHLQVLRWLLDIRILSHARSSLQFLEMNKDTAFAEREAALAAQLDPVNATGTAAIAYYSLGTIAILQNNLEQAKEYFFSAMQSSAVEEAQAFTLLSVVRYANVVEMEGKRSEAIPLYQRVIAEGKKNLSVFAPAVFLAEKYLLENFVLTDDVRRVLY